MDQLNALQLNREDTYKNRLMVALKAARVCIYEVDLTRQLYTFFENAEDIFGISGEEILAQVQPYSALSPEEYHRAVAAYFSHPDDAPVIAVAFDKILHGQQTSYEARMRAGDSRFVWCKLDVVPILEDGRPVRMIGVITDISEARKQKELLEQKVNLDGFTGLWNKKYSFASIRAALKREPEGRHALLILDVDNFKHFNDTYGHAAGDQLLLSLSDRLTRAFPVECIIGRFGGDEFIVFVPQVRDLDLLLAQAQALTCLEQGGHAATSSVGIALYPDHGTSFSALFERADQALYYAKKRRKAAVLAQTGETPP